MKHHAGRGVGVARRDSRREHPVDDAATCSFSEDPKRWIKATTPLRAVSL